MNKFSILFLTSVLLIANIIFSYLKFINGDDLFYQEHEVVEILQACLLALSCIVFLIHSFFLEKPNSFILLSLSLLCLTFFLREVDLEDFDLPAFLIYIGSDIGRNILISTLWVLMAIFMAMDYRKMKPLIFQFFWSRPGNLILISGVLLIASDVLERWFLGAAFSEFFEELLEFNAYYILFWSSLISRNGLPDMSKNPTPFCT